MPAVSCGMSRSAYWSRVVCPALFRFANNTGRDRLSDLRVATRDPQLLSAFAAHILLWFVRINPAGPALVPAAGKTAEREGPPIIVWRLLPTGLPRRAV